jgi:ABC-2 type transport system permease protein
MGSVFLLTLRQLSGRWRLSILTVLALLPVLIAILVVNSSDAPTVQEFENSVLSAMLAGSISPLVVLAIATAAFAVEVEDRTLANLTLSPIPRWQIVVPKLLAAICISAPFMSLSAFFTGYFAFSGDWVATFAVTAGAFVGVALYSSAFVWLGLKTTRAIGYGLLYIVLWEGFFSGYVAGVRFLSVRYYSIALMRGLDPRRFIEADDLSFGFAIVASVVVFVGFVLLSIRRLRNMDVP